MTDIVHVFTAIRKAHESLDVQSRTEIALRIMKEMGLNDREEYLAMKTYGLLSPVGLDYDEAYEVFGRDTIQNWIKDGTVVDDFHPLAGSNLDHWYTPELRKKYYAEYPSTLRRLGSMSVKLHPYYTIAEIEHAIRMNKK